MTARNAPQDARNRRIGPRTAITLALIVLTSAAISITMLTRNHEWGDDFAGYVMQAQSIVTGKMDEFVARNAFTIEHSDRDVGAVTAPWGFPLLLSPFYAAFGLEPFALKLAGTLCYACFLVVFFFLARRRSRDAEALLLTTVLAYSPALLDAQNGILLDIPFLLVSTLALLLMLPLQDEAERTWTRPALVGLALFAAAFTRVNGVLLFLPLLVVQACALRSGMREGAGRLRLLGRMATPYVVFAAAYAAQSLVFPAVNMPARRVMGTHWAAGLLGDLPYYLKLPTEMFDLGSGLGPVIYAVLAAFFLVSLIRHWREEAPLHVYILATLALYASYPSRQGLRYIFPILPLFVLLAHDGMSVVRRSFTAGRRREAAIAFRAAWLALAILSLTASVQAASKNLANGRAGGGGAEEAFSPESTRMFEFIRNNTPPSSVVIFFKPRAMRLLTDRDSFRTGDCREFRHGDYAVLIKDPTARYQLPPGEKPNCGPSLQLTPVYDSNGFIAYQITRSH